MTAEEWMAKFEALAEEARADGAEVQCESCCCSAELWITKAGSVIKRDI